MSISSVSANVDIANIALQRLGQAVITTLTESSRDANLANQLFAQNRDYCFMLLDWDCLKYRLTMTRSSKNAITTISKANPMVITSSGHLLVTNKLVYVESVVGMTQVNGQTYRVFAYTSNTITCYDTTGAAVDSSAYSSYTSGGFVYRSPSANWAFVYDLPSDCMKVIEVLDSTFGMEENYIWRKEGTYLYTDTTAAGVLYIRQETDPTVFTADLVEVMSSRLAWLMALRIGLSEVLREKMFNEYIVALNLAKKVNHSGARHEKSFKDGVADRTEKDDKGKAVE